ncbi:LytTR family DNA-binding domain-containing protein [Pseudooctadecabacter jejudonensis]|uniref:CO-responsive transcriptional regulator RcoM n=1 Tax=Pseudooctadecabacter jejudonensis TaxID=1391910 RepID=A0A1Y5SF22_9RHOB|nr:LytTR family DNA-binding domain-containing protein [Pseudooctadecabacter jejudonensis]SLN38886.1 CO-responsive transcriptional regulator RcoM [Pseudooctadecabacter jejudonensis]
MNDTPPQSALREWRAHMGHPPRAAALIGAAVILTVMAPFETDRTMRAAPRLAYWVILVATTYSTGFFANMFATLLAGPDAPVWKKAALGATLTSLGVFAVVYVLNGLAFDFWASGAIAVEGFINVAVIASIISVIFHMIDAGTGPAPDSPALSTDHARPALLDRVPLDKRGTLVSISVEDHYVRVRTTKGEEMLLLRLGDALREVPQDAGLHVHRSHWIATDQVTAAVRKGDGALLSMTHGPDIPVSRANVAKLKEAGLLPRS